MSCDRLNNYPTNGTRQSPLKSCDANLVGQRPN